MVQKQDIFNELNHLALGSRLKRLSDRMMSDVAALYQEFNCEIEPSSFPVLACLDRHAPLGIVELANLIGVTQPAVSRGVKDLKMQRLVKLSEDKDDLRRKSVELSAEGKKLVQRLKGGLWPAVRAVAVELCALDSGDFLDQVKEIENRLDDKSLSQRAKEKAHASAKR